MRTGAVVAGNGPSRLAFDLAAVQRRFVLFGCNEIFREVTPDWLIYGDSRIEAIVDREAPEMAGLRPDAHHMSGQWESAGGFSVHAACSMGHKRIYLLGFDGGAQNIYPMAGASDDALAHQARRWRVGLARVKAKFPEVAIVQVNDARTHLDGLFERISLAAFQSLLEAT